jgi:4-hydroxy-4-methyl-2-oxoglutarate aldolase
MKPVVVRKIPRVEAAVAMKLGKLGTATVHEAIGRRGLMKPYMRPIWPGAAIAGPGRDRARPSR